MFDIIRDRKKFLMGFLLILIIPSFVLFGVEGYTRFNEGGAAVASVDGKKIKRAEWDQAHRQEVERLRAMVPNIDSALLDSDIARYESLERLVRQRVLAAAVAKLNLYTPDQRLARELQQNQAIASLRKPDGSLDVEAYRQLLSRQGMTPEIFEASVRADLSQRQVLQGVQATGFGSSAMARATLNAFFEQRELRVKTFTARDFASRVNPSEADIEAFYQQNQALFQAPEQADVEYLVLDAAALQKGISISEADLRSYYDQNASQLSGAEERRASHILLSVPNGATPEQKAEMRKKAEALLAEARANPAKFAELAKANSQDPGSAANGGDLDFFGKGAMVPPFEQAVFALRKGQISDIVETDFGFHIIQLTDIKAPPVKSFAELRPQLEAQLRQQQAQRQYAEAADTFSNLVYEQPQSLQPAAERLKLTVQTAKGVLRTPAAGQTGPLANARLLGALFAPESISSKRNTEAIDVGGSQLVAARIVEHRPAHTQPLAEVREQARSRLVAQRAAELAKEEAEKQLAAWKGGADAAAMGPVLKVSRESAQSMDPRVLDAALAADPKALPAWIGVPLGQQGHAVVQVVKVLPRAEVPAERQAQEVQQVGQGWSGAESEAYYETLKARFKARILVPKPAENATPPAR
ncbi:MAG: SurA N-terminal domain-containing protein [Hydrogenophaga sp.]|uniref:SurA N-terminal domain-containing protein n=1 Tax=Hydrogenophaga sp. TaxID=1904254 RepID=UPI002579E40A|nr:SurA N-terminal domain-containing protein [Hydrogenophaga sp.]MBL0944565.1 SurA N-terminal domain-containing protein [Hydrogenophaga sp.]